LDIPANTGPFKVHTNHDPALHGSQSNCISGSNSSPFKRLLFIVGHPDGAPKTVSVAHIRERGIYGAYSKKNKLNPVTQDGSSGSVCAILREEKGIWGLFPLFLHSQVQRSNPKMSYVISISAVMRSFRSNGPTSQVIL
jgi:hypothetical protein